MRVTAFELPGQIWTSSSFGDAVGSRPLEGALLSAVG